MQLTEKQVWERYDQHRTYSSYAQDAIIAVMAVLSDPTVVSVKYEDKHGYEISVERVVPVPPQDRVGG